MALDRYGHELEHRAVIERFSSSRRVGFGAALGPMRNEQGLDRPANLRHD